MRASRQAASLGLLLLVGTLAAQADAQPVAPDVAGAVVLISGTDAAGALRTGAGFVVDPSGIVVTNLRSIRGLSKASVRLANGDRYDVSHLRAFNQARDIVILQIRAFGLAALELGNPDSMVAGDQLTLMGIPLGGPSAAVAVRIAEVQRLGEEGYRLFRLDTPMDSTNSGGPILDRAGKVIALAALRGTGQELLPVALPINYVRGLLANDEKLTLRELASESPVAVSTPSESANTSAPVPPDVRGVATVVFYRLRRFYGGALEPSVYCDDNELATMDNGRYFKVQLSAGPHVCHSTDASAVPLDLRAGETYFVRMEIITGFMKGQGGLLEVTPRQAETELTRVKPLDKSNVRNSSVFVP
jgi:hypothetical protein